MGELLGASCEIKIWFVLYICQHCAVGKIGPYLSYIGMRLGSICIHVKLFNDYLMFVMKDFDESTIKCKQCMDFLDIITLSVVIIHLTNLKICY